MGHDPAAATPMNASIGPAIAPPANAAPNARATVAVLGGTHHFDLLHDAAVVE